MAKYEIHVFCDDCCREHFWGISVELDDRPADKQSIGDTYNGKDVPPQLLGLHNNSFIRMTEGKPKRRLFISSSLAKTILVGDTQFLKLRLAQFDGLTPAALSSTGELITAALAILDLCVGQILNEPG
jgi:hypothetical protein